MKNLTVCILLILLVVALGLAFDRALDIEFPPEAAVIAPQQCLDASGHEYCPVISVT